MNAISNAGPVDTTASPSSTWRTLPFGAAQIAGGFWAGQRRTNRQVSLRHGYAMLERAGNLQNLRLAAGRTQGTFQGRNFSDETVYKWLEAMAWELGGAPDPELQRMADEVIELVAAAQQPDGYLNSHYTVAAPDQRWADLDHSHELYCAGHLFQAAVAFQRACGDGRLLAVARRFADYIDSVFGPGRREGTDGHPEVEMALVELYRCTGEPRYLRLAQFFIDQRGRRRMRGYASYGPEYHQDHLPVREADEAVGHAVRQMYLAAGVSDVCLETGDPELGATLERLWHDVTATKLFITGGLGSRFDGEAFGDPYELPSDQCYCETCAAIGGLMWNWRLLLRSGEARFADEIERALYNGILSSPALDGRHYFYVNTLQSRGSRFMRASSNAPAREAPPGRPEWHRVACCPPNVMRLLASLGHYLATAGGAGLQLHQYAEASIAATLDVGAIGLQVATEYPWQGRVAVTVAETPEAAWTLRLRVPGWCRQATATINGEPAPAQALPGSYLALDRRWRAGDVVVLELAMAPLLLAAHPRVDALRSCLALQRGPLVYCLESHDQPAGSDLLDLQLDPDAALRAEWRADLLGGVMLIHAGGYALEPEAWGDALYQPRERAGAGRRRPLPLTAIPYYAWANRGIEAMRVWVPAATP